MLLTGCNPVSPLLSTKDTPVHLLELDAFDANAEPIVVPDLQPLLTSEGMKRFVATDIANVANDRLRVRRLIDKLADNGYYTESYDSSLTQTSASTFVTGKGNCLSHTHLFIALARQAGLDAYYEVVDAPPTYSTDRGVLEHQTHIRARVLLPSRVHGSQTVSVDFNSVPTENFQGRLVTDRFAKSLHYGNDAIAYWLQGDEARAFAYILKAIDLEPEHADHWVNLATFYARKGRLEEALQLNRYALQLNSSHMVALAGIVALSDESEVHRVKTMLERYRARNPFYQLALAKRAHHNGYYTEALLYVERSIDLDRSNPELLGFRGEVLMKLTDYPAARDSYAQALRFAETDSQRNNYQQGIESAEQAADG